MRIQIFYVSNVDVVVLFWHNNTPPAITISLIFWGAGLHIICYYDAIAHTNSKGATNKEQRTPYHQECLEKTLGQNMLKREGC